jgi:hypothetical protein
VPEFIDPFTKTSPISARFQSLNTSVWAGFRENWVYNLGHSSLLKSTKPQHTPQSRVLLLNYFLALKRAYKFLGIFFITDNYTQDMGKKQFYDQAILESKYSEPNI